jgi:hypothetical protein
LVEIYVQKFLGEDLRSEGREQSEMTRTLQQWNKDDPSTLLRMSQRSQALPSATAATIHWRWLSQEEKVILGKAAPSAENNSCIG